MTAPADRRYRLLFWTLALVGFAVDQGTKYGIFAWLYTDTPRYVNPTTGKAVCDSPFSVVPGTFDLVARYTTDPWEGTGLLHQLRTVSGPNIPHVNHGALFGIGGDIGFGNNLFLAISLTAALGISLFITFHPSAARDRYLCFALGLILAGTLGNFYDRLVFGGVRDFLHWYRWYDWPVFNVADCCLVCGAGLLVLETFLRSPATEAAPKETETAVAATPV